MKQEEYILPNNEPSFIITPDEGKVLVRKTDGQIYYSPLKLGYNDIDGEIRLETPDDYEEQDMPEIEPEVIDVDILYKNLVETYIREKYTISDELALLRQRDTKVEEYNEYYEYCEACKTRAKEELGL